MDNENLNTNENTGKEGTQVADNKNKNPEPPKAEGKKPGKIRTWLKKHKRELIVGAASFGAGVGGTIGVSELGRRHQMKKASRTYVPDQVNPLDPNL